jgi:hypothetical protein
MQAAPLQAIQLIQAKRTLRRRAKTQKWANRGEKEKKA